MINRGSKMKGKIFAIIFLLNFAFSLTLYAQWARTYGGSEDDNAQTIIQTSDGGYIVAGETESFGNGDPAFWILKLDLLGNIEWQITNEQRFGEKVFSIVETNDRGFIVAGRFGGTAFFEGGFDILILKLSSDGNKEWARSYRGSDSDHAHSIQQTNDGGYILTGYFGDRDQQGNTIQFEYDVWVLKLFSNGDKEWCKTYKGNMYDFAYSIQQTNDGGYIVAGKTESFGAGLNDILILKLNLSGDVEWQKTYGGSLEEEAYFIRQTIDGGYIVAGFSNSYGAGSFDFCVLKLTVDGTIEWQKLYGGIKSDKAYSIQQTIDGGYIVVGETYSFGAGNEDVWILKLNILGEIEWQKTYGGSLADKAHSIQQTSDGGYIVAGPTSSYGSGKQDLLILKLFSNGYIDSFCEFINNSNAVVTNLGLTPVDISIILEDTNIPPSTLDITFQDSESVTYSLCSGKHTLSITTSSGGTTLPQPDSYIHDHAEIVNLKVKPYEGYVFIGWSGDVQSTDIPLLITMDSDKSVKANFIENIDDTIDDIIEKAKKAPCFIATAAFGSPLHPYVRTLQDFRDKYLMSSRPGRKLVKLYYKYSPHIAELITNHKVLRSVVRIWLVPFVAVGYSMVNFGPVKTSLMLILSIMPLFFFVWFYRRRSKSAKSEL